MCFSASFLCLLVRSLTPVTCKPLAGLWPKTHRCMPQLCILARKITNDMIASLIGAGIGLAGSLIAANNSKKQAANAQKQLDDQGRRKQLWYERLYNENPTQTAAAQGALTAAREEAMNMVKSARGMDATTGGGGQAMAAAQRAAGKMIADTTSSIAASGQARKDAIDSQYQQGLDALTDKYYALYNQRAANNAAAGSSALKAGADLAGVDMQYALNSGRDLFKDVFNKA